MASYELIQFDYSTFNEKARWALDWKGVAHRRRSLLPGPHMGAVKKLTGQTATPVLVIDGVALAGSAAILDRLEREVPEPALYPGDAHLRRRALEIQRRFDEDWGPRTRRVLIADLLAAPGHLARMFGASRTPAKRFVYRCLLPFAGGLIRRGNGIAGPETIADGERAAEEAFDFVAAESAATGYLAGPAFSLADLVAGAFLAPFVDPEHRDMKMPAPVPPPIAARTERWRAHPGGAWALQLYREHRAPPPRLTR